jgi:hypothetical protein
MAACSADRAVRGSFVLAAAVAASCSTCDAVIGAESRIRSELIGLRNGFRVDVTGSEAIAIDRADFREAQVFSDRAGYYVNALVDADGRAGEEKVSYLGVEDIRFARKPEGWRAEPPVLRNLAGLVTVLRPGAPSGPIFWVIRVDRGEAQVFQQSQADDASAGGGNRRHFTLRQQGGRWFFTSGADGG